jgi:hypothetical protein
VSIKINDHLPVDCLVIVSMLALLFPDVFFFGKVIYSHNFSPGNEFMSGFTHCQSCTKRAAPTDAALF